MPEPRLPVSDRELAPDPQFWSGRARNGVRRPLPQDGLLERVRDRMQLLRGDSRAGIVLLVVIAVVVGYLWYRAGAGADAGAPSARVANSSSRPTSGLREPAGTAPSPSQRGGSGARVVVHVAGDVVKPGIVELAEGARVVDAVEAAGGGGADADLDRLNLAAKVVDGQRILVQHVGDPPAPADAATAPGDPAGSGGPINLNAATAAQLDEALPGIGPKLAEAIVAERDRRGGFRSVNELRDVRGIGDKRFTDIKDKVTV